MLNFTRRLKNKNVFLRLSQIPIHKQSWLRRGGTCEIACPRLCSQRQGRATPRVSCVYIHYTTFANRRVAMH